MKYIFLLIGLTAALQLVSAIGSSCVALDPLTWRIPSFAIIEDYHLIYLVCYATTWVVAIAWGVLGWALKENKAWFYKTAVIASVAGIVSGIIPIAILFMGGMRFTPSWFRVIANMVMLLLLLIPRVKNDIKARIEEGSATGGNLGSQVTSMALVLLGAGILLITQPFFMPVTHIVDGIQVGYEFEALQFFGGLFFMLLGTIMHLAGRYISKVHSATTVPNAHV